MSDAVRRLPPPSPQPVPGCGRCADYARKRRAARLGRDLSAATDINVQWGHHHNQAHPGETRGGTVVDQALARAQVLRTEYQDFDQAASLERIAARLAGLDLDSTP